jgi:hypothetical protein
MNKILIILLLFSTNIFPLSSSKLKIEDVKKGIEYNNIDLQKIDLLNENINDIEIKILKILSTNDDDFHNKKITFITGPAGTTLSTKSDFFKSFLNYYSNNHILQDTIIKLEENEKEMSGSDYLIFFWVKMMNPKSKKLLKRIKKYNSNF